MTCCCSGSSPLPVPLALLAISLGLIAEAAGGRPQLYELGNWPAPFGIVLVLDRLSALMVLLSSLLAVVVSVYAATSGWDKRGRHFHALLQFQLMGINGRISDRRRLQPLRVLRSLADRLLLADAARWRHRQNGSRCAVRRGQSRRLDPISHRRRHHLRRHRDPQYGRPCGQGAVGSCWRPGAAAGRRPCCCWWFSRSRRRWSPSISGCRAPTPTRRDRWRPFSPL